VTTFVLGADTVHSTAALCDYLDGLVDADDRVVAVNSHPGGDETTSEDLRDGEDALNVTASRLAAVCDVETHQFVRGNDPATDLLEAVEAEDADELVIGVRERTPAAKVVFGSTAQEVLLRSNVPVRVVPLETV